MYCGSNGFIRDISKVRTGGNTPHPKTVVGTGKRFAASRNTLKMAVYHHFLGNGRGAHNTHLAKAISGNSHLLIR